jgi:hypothetical protein
VTLTYFSSNSTMAKELEKKRNSIISMVISQVRKNELENRP